MSITIKNKYPSYFTVEIDCNPVHELKANETYQQDPGNGIFGVTCPDGTFNGCYKVKAGDTIEIVDYYKLTINGTEYDVADGGSCPCRSGDKTDFSNIFKYTPHILIALYVVTIAYLYLSKKR